MKQTIGKQKIAHPTATITKQEPRGTRGVALAPPAPGVAMANNQPVQRMINGQPENCTGLPDRLKAGVEQLSGLAMDDVRVHYNSTKPAQVQALAYTQGTEIHMGPGQERHLPHEAWHVVQQKRERVPTTLHTKGVSINDNRNLEHEAQVMGTRALHVKYSDSGKSQAAIQPVTTIQRMVIAGLPLPNKRKIEMNQFTSFPDTIPSAVGPSTVPTPTVNIGQLRTDVATANRVPYTPGNANLIKMDMVTANRVPLPYTTGNADLVNMANIEQIRRHSLSKSGRLPEYV